MGMAQERAAIIRALCLILLLSLASFSSDVVVDIDTSAMSTFSAGFSGFNAPQLRNAAEYSDLNLRAVASKLRPGWLRFPAGAAADAYDWTVGGLDSVWMSQFSGIPKQFALLSRAQKLSQAKGGVWLSDFGAFAGALGARSMICLNGFTDDNPSSARDLVVAAQANGLNVIAWELANEPFFFVPSFFASASAFASQMHSTLYADIIAGSPDAVAAMPFAGRFNGTIGDFTSWDAELAAYSPRFWNAVSTHIFPLTNSSLSSTEIQSYLNGVLAHGSTEYIDSYFLPMIGSDTPIYISELNSTANESLGFQSYLYNGLFLVEYILRLSTHSSVKHVGVQGLYMGNAYKSGIIQARRDFESHLINTVYPNSVDTSGWGFGFFLSAPGLALNVANGAVNSSTRLWRTTATGGTTVPILGYDGLAIPAVYAQAYYGNNGKRYLVMTNKAAVPQTVTVRGNGVFFPGPFSLVYVANNDPTAANTPSAPTSVRVQTGAAASTITLPPYCVMRAEW
jgi:hypothetical protein